MTIRAGEIGKLFRYAANNNLSANTDLSLTFTRPDKTKFTVSNPRVTAPAISVDDPDVGFLEASTYFQMPTEATDFPTAGTYSVCPTYEDATPRTLYGQTVTFTVLEGC